MPFVSLPETILTIAEYMVTAERGNGLLKYISLKYIQIIVTANLLMQILQIFLLHLMFYILVYT